MKIENVIRQMNEFANAFAEYGKKAFGWIKLIRSKKTDKEAMELRKEIPYEDLFEMFDPDLIAEALELKDHSNRKAERILYRFGQKKRVCDATKRRRAL